MDITRLQTFKVLCETRSFTKTARKIFVTQPAVSQHISKLQSDLGVKLIQKINNNLILTIAGAALYESIKKEISSLEETVKNISNNEQALSVNIMGPYVFINNNLIPEMAKLNDSKKKTCMHFMHGNSLMCAEALLAGKIDIGIVSTPLQLKTFYCKKIFEEKMVFACNAKYFDATIKDNLKNVLSINMVDMSADYRLFNKWIEFNSPKVDIKSILVAEIKSIVGIINYIKNANAAAIVPRRLIDNEINFRKLVTVMDQYSKYKNVLYLVKLRKRIDADLDIIYNDLLKVSY